MANVGAEKPPDWAWRRAMAGAVGAAGQVARHLDAGTIGADHLFAALAAGRPDGAARAVLAAAGLDPDALRASMLAEPPTTEDPAAEDPAPDGPSRRQLSPNPRLHRVLGRAEGFAASRHGGPPGSVDLLLALLWDQDWRTTALLAERGVTPEDVVRTLARRGEPVPPAPPPPADPPLRSPLRMDVPRESLGRVLGQLAERHPPGSDRRWGFNNTSDGGAYVVAEEGIDLPAIVAESR